MRFSLANAEPKFACHCTGCNKRLWSGDQEVWADLDGPSFRSYYCVVCKNTAEQLNQAIKGLE